LLSHWTCQNLENFSHYTSPIRRRPLAAATLITTNNAAQDLTANDRVPAVPGTAQNCLLLKCSPPLAFFLPSRDDRNVVHGGRPRLFFFHFFREVSSKSSFSEVTTSAGGICFCSVCTAMCCPEHNEKGWKANASQ
jgi:hypothetical protein